jgi:hypothetical protein
MRTRGVRDAEHAATGQELFERHDDAFRDEHDRAERVRHVGRRSVRAFRHVSVPAAVVVQEPQNPEPETDCGDG